MELEEYSSEGVHIAKKTLVGKFITEKMINRGAVKVIILKLGEKLRIWRCLIWAQICSFSLLKIGKQLGGF